MSIIQYGEGIMNKYGTFIYYKNATDQTALNNADDSQFPRAACVNKLLWVSFSQLIKHLPS